MSLELNFKPNSESRSQRLSLQDGESLQVFSGQSFQIRNPEIVAQLVPQDKDLQIVCHDGESYLLKSFLDVEFEVEPQLQLQEGDAITWHNFVQQTDGIEQAIHIDDNNNPTLAFAPLIVIAASAESPDWKFARIEPDQGERSETAPQPPAENGLSFAKHEENEAASSSSRAPSLSELDREEDEAIKLSPTGDLTQSVDEETNGLSSIESQFFEVDFERLVDLGSHEGSQPTIVARIDGQDEIEVVIDQDNGTARIPSGVFEDDNQIDIVIVVDDGTRQNETKITVTETKDGNGETFHLLLSHDRISENIEGALIGKLDTNDGGAGREFAYTLSEDSSDLFEIVGNVLKLKDGVSIDYEAHPEAYPIRIVAEDDAGHRIEQTVDIWPEDVNEVASAQSFGLSGIEDVSVTFDPEDFDKAFDDEDKDYLEMVKIDVLPENGTLYLGGDPVTSGQLIDYEQIEDLSFRPNENWNGETNFFWSGFDGQAWSSENSPVSISIAAVNDAPVVKVAVGDQVAGTEVAYSLELPEGSFIDVDEGDTLTYSADLPSWLSIDPQTGALSGTPQDGDIGDHTVTITATDPSGESVSQDFKISVANTNDAPTFTQISNTYINEDSLFELDAGSYFDDADIEHGDELTFSASLEDGSPLPDWLAFDASTGALSGTPTNDELGALRIRISASDGEADVSQTFTLNVENVNDAPTLVADIEDQSIDEDTAFNLETSSHFEDVDVGDQLTFSAELSNGDPLPDWLAFDPATGTFSGTPRNADVGALEVTVTASDGEESTNATFAIDVANTNDGPVVTSEILNQLATEDTPFSLDVSDNFADVDLGDVLSFSATLEDGSPLPDWLSIDSETGELSGSPSNDDVGDLTIVVTASDGEATATDTFGLSVENTNDGPMVVTPIDDASTDEDSLFELDTASHFDDIDQGDTLSFSATLENGEPLPDWLAFDSESGSLSGTPRNADVGDLRIEVTASDGEADVSQAFTLSIENTNDAPTLVSDIEAANAVEDSVFGLDVSSHFSDEDLGDTLSYSATLEGGDPLPDWLSFDSNTGQLSGTPENDDVGDLSITFTATDGEASASDTFSIAVQNTNDSPILVETIDNQTTDEDSLFELETAASFDDVDLGDTLSYSATLKNGDDLPDWLSIDPETGSLSGTPENGDVGTISVTVSASDGQASVSDTFFVTVENTNDGPVVTSGIEDQTTEEGSVFSLDTQSSFEDIDVGDSLSYSATLESGEPLPGWLSINPNTGRLSGKPDNEDVGEISVTVTASDGEAEASDTFSITVENTNDGPVATAISDQSVDEDRAFELDVSNHFSDEDLGDTLTFSAQLDNGDDLPEWLAFDSTTGEFTGTPSNDDVGELGISVTASDGESDVSRSFTLEVENTNDAPILVANIDDAVAPEDSAFSLETADAFDDPDAGDALTFSATLEGGDPLPDWLSIDSETGQLSGTPRNGDVGDLSLTVTASDGEASSSDTFSISVENSNDGPIATAIDNQAIDEDDAFELDISNNFSDEDLGDTLSFSATQEDGSDLPDWLSFDGETGRFSGTPENGDVGDLSVIVTASDGEERASDTFGISVSNTNDGPVATASIDDQSADEDASFELDASNYFEDVDEGDTLSYSATLEGGDSLPDWLSIDSETGQLSGTPRNEDVGDLQIEISVSDGETETSQSFTLSVENTNDAPTLVSNINDANATEDAAFSLDISANFADEDIGDELSYSATLEDGSPLPNWLSIDSETGELSGTPENKDVGDISVKVIATDGEAQAEDTFALSVANTNDGPVVVSEIDDQSIDEGSPFELDVSENFADEDAGDTLSYSATLDNGDPLPNWLSIDSETGEFSGTPDDGDVGSFNVVVRLSDGEETTQDTFSITVNDVDEFDVSAITDTDASANEVSEAASAGDSVGIAAFAEDDDATNSDVTYSLSDDADGAFQIDEDSGEITVADPSKIDFEDSQTLTVEVTATSEDGSASTKSFDIAVNNINEGPTLETPLADQTTDEDAAFSLDVSGNFDDVDAGDTLTFSAELTNESGETIGDGSLPSWLSFDDSTGQFSGTPNNGDVGTFCVKVTASDGSESASDIVGITVENTNDGPVASSDSNSIGEDSSSVGGNVLSNDSDEDAGDSLIVSDVTGGSAGAATSGNYGDIVINGDGSYTYNLDSSSTTVQSLDDGETLQDNFTYTVSDGNGGTDTETVTITINGSNDGPTLETFIADQSIKEGNAFSLDISDRFSDIDASDSLSYSVLLTNESGDQIGDGSLPNWLGFDSGTGQFSGTPDDGDVSEFCVQVTATDGTASVSDIFAIDVTASGPDPDETIHGGNGAQTIVTGSGDDWVDGGSGADNITTNAGDDYILGGSGADTIDAGSGNDTIDGGVGLDTIDAGAGDDTIYATEGKDIVDAGEGNDTLIVEGSKNYGTLDGEEGFDTLQLNDSGIDLDFSKVNSDISNIESIDISGSGSNNLTISADEVLDITDSENKLFIDGDSDDSIEISDDYQLQVGTETRDGVDYDHYYDSNTDTHLYINNNITDLDTF